MPEQNLRSRTGEPCAGPLTSRASGSHGGSEGFTLLEVLVALTILGMSFAVLLAIFSQALTRERARDQALAARLLAQSLIAQAVSARAIDFGETSGRADSGLSWQLRVEPDGNPSGTQKPRFQAARVSVRVTWLGAGTRHAVTLATMRLVPQDPGK